MDETLMGVDVYLTRASFNILQEGNSLGTTSDSEEMTVDVEFQLPDAYDLDSKAEDFDKYNGPFFVIKTEGWSINSDHEDFSCILNAINKSCFELNKKISLEKND